VSLIKACSCVGWYEDGGEEEGVVTLAADLSGGPDGSGAMLATAYSVTLGQ
jgi:hypothetical protein